MKDVKLKGEFRDTRGQGVTQYHSWFMTQKDNSQETREKWVKKIIAYLEKQGGEKKKMATYLKNRKACHIVGFAPYIEYMKHKPEGGMTLDGVYLHAFGNPSLLVFDKKTKCLLIINPELDFNTDNGIRG